MSTATRLDFEEATRFLRSLHGVFGWDRLLLKNTFDLTPGYPAIPSQGNRNGFSYTIGDLQILASQYAQGKISQEHIEKRTGEFMSKFNDKQNGYSATVQTDDDEPAAILAVERFDKVINGVVSIAQALHTINIALGTVGMHIKDGELERAALQRVTEDYYERAFEIVNTLDALREDLFEAGEDKFSAGDIEALMMGELDTV